MLVVKFFFFLFLVTSTLSAQELNPEQQSTYMDTIRSVMSPYCPGKLLSDCPSTKASELKSTIKNKINQGASKEQIITFLEEQYGKETIKSEPDKKGFGILAWLVPIIFLLSGILVFIKWLRYFCQKSIPPSLSPTDASLQKIEARAIKDLTNQN